MKVIPATDDVIPVIVQYVGMTQRAPLWTNRDSSLGRWLAAVALFAIARTAVVSAGGPDMVMHLLLGIVLFAAARRHGHMALLIAAGGIAIVSDVVVCVLDDEPFWLEIPAEIGLSLLPLAIGYALSVRELQQRDAFEREAEARVAEERLRLARDLHDVVAHSLSTIAVQSGVASHVADKDPAQVRAALDAINDASKESLEELRSMVGVLRSTEPAPLAPVPTSAKRLESLVAAAERNGLDVTLHTTGQAPVGASNITSLATNRIVQEALTNVARHAGAVETSVTVNHGEQAVAILVANKAGAPPTPTLDSAGVGIIGMVERAELLGGTLTAVRTSTGGFRVAATIPYCPNP